MTTPPAIDLRQSALSQVLWVASLVVAVGMVVAVLSFDSSGWFTVVFIAAAVAISVANTARALSRVTTSPDGGLVVRNWFATTTLRPADVDRVMTGRQGGPGSLHRVELLLVDGSTLHLVATEGLPIPGGKVRLDEHAAQLRAWAAGG